MARLVKYVLAIWTATAMPVLADQATVHITGMGVNQRVDHARALVSNMDLTVNTMFHDDPITVGSIIIRMPENDVREEWTDAEFRGAIARELRAHVDAYWRAGRREFEIHLIQDNTLLAHAVHDLTDIQDDVGKFSRAAYGAIGDVLTEIEGRGHQIGVDASLGSNDTAGFVLANEAWRPWENMIRRVTLVDGRAPLGLVRDALDVLGGPRIRIVNSQFDAPAAPDWMGGYQNIAFLGNSERLHAQYPGLQLLWVRPTEELVFTKGHIRTLLKLEESFEVSLYLGAGFYADIGDFTGWQIHARHNEADYIRFANTGVPPVGYGKTPLRGLVYDRNAYLRVGAEMAFGITENLILLNDVIHALDGTDSWLPLGDMQALAENLGRDIQKVGPDGSIKISAETVLSMSRLQLALMDISDYGAVDMIEGAVRVQHSIGDPEGVMLVLDGFSDFTAALAGINPLQVKVARKLGRRLTAPAFNRLVYEVSGTAEKILEQAEQRQQLAVNAGFAPVPMDQLLGPQELSVVGFWRRLEFNRRWRVRASPRATVTSSYSVRRETCIAGRCGSVTLDSGIGRAVGVYSADFKATAARRARGSSALTNKRASVQSPLAQIWPLKSSKPATRRLLPKEPEAIRHARNALLPCIGSGPGCIRIKMQEPEARSCAERGDCPPPDDHLPLFWRGPDGPDGVLDDGGDGPEGGPGGGEAEYRKGPGSAQNGPGGPSADGGQDMGGVLIAPAFTTAPTEEKSGDIRTLLSGCDFSVSAACDLSP
ncbi:MAG: hypothetical protein ABJI96_16810 [Paracoccaceae bacterium]